MARDDPPAALRLVQPRTGTGRFQSSGPALARFAAKCRFDPTTGCVLWAGGKTSGRGNSAEYGSFWDDGRRHFAHRWSAENIHGHDIDGLQVGHTCPHGPNTLCVEHVEPQTQAENLAEQRARLGGVAVSQSAAERQYWLFVSIGLEPAPEPPRPDGDAIPFYAPPEWLRPFLAQSEDDECPF